MVAGFEGLVIEGDALWRDRAFGGRPRADREDRSQGVVIPGGFAKVGFKTYDRPLPIMKYVIVTGGVMSGIGK